MRSKPGTQFKVEYGFDITEPLFAGEKSPILQRTLSVRKILTLRKRLRKSMAGDKDTKGSRTAYGLLGLRVL
jgi:hypothetical protein